MKKFAVVMAVILVAALAAPALSATNPFMDVPMNHWAYDAIGQLAAHGILSGFPDGTYKGQQQTTRYELASALARSLAVVDMTKASKQDVEMLKRLVVEFKDELEALGVQVAELDERVAVYENRLGGWHIHGQLELDVDYRKANEAPNAKGNVHFDNARIFIERTFGENDEYFFQSRLGGESGTFNMDRFFVEMPFFLDSRLTVGKYLRAFEGRYMINLHDTGSWGGDQLLTDWAFTGFGVTKNFGLGSVQFHAAHPNKYSTSDWMAMLYADLQFSERVGIDLGAQAFFGDNAETFENKHNRTKDGSLHDQDDKSFKNLWTVFAGLHFNFTDDVALKGTFYTQKSDSEIVDYADNRYFWRDYGLGVKDGANYEDKANHWSVIVDVKQPALKFTSLWLEYGQFGKGFHTRSDSGIFYSGSSVLSHYGLTGNNRAEFDTKYYRIALTQEWNDKVATHLFYYGYIADEYYNNKDNVKPFEVGAGVQYKLNDATTMGLNYVHVDSKVDNKTDNYDTKDDLIKFRTTVVF